MRYRFCLELVNGQIKKADYGELNLSPDDTLQAISDDWDRTNTIQIDGKIYNCRQVVCVWLEEDPEEESSTSEPENK